MTIEQIGLIGDYCDFIDKINKIGNDIVEENVSKITLSKRYVNHRLFFRIKKEKTFRKTSNIFLETDLDLENLNILCFLPVNNILKIDTEKISIKIKRIETDDNKSIQTIKLVIDENSDIDHILFLIKESYENI